ncbi:MAG: HAD-IIA family hydrolase [Anaerolineae bacterium]
MHTNLAQIKALIIDMDGVLYRGKAALPGSADIFNFLEENKIKFQVVTNNATVNAAMVKAKLETVGIDLAEQKITTSGAAAAAYIAAQAPAGAGVFVLGEEPLVQEVTNRGLRLAGNDADYVVVALDRTVTYDKLRTATIAIRRGAKFIGTNPDKTLPMENDVLVPGAGSIIAAVSAATDQEPLYIGKPEPTILNQVLDELQVAPHEAASLGDRLETDILGGKRTGMTTILVMTGVTTSEALAHSELQPDYVFQDIPALLREWQHRLNE